MKIHQFPQEMYKYSFFSWGTSSYTHETRSVRLLDEDAIVLVEGLRDGESVSVISVILETILWAYSRIKCLPYYWYDKKICLSKLFRSANIAVIKRCNQKQSVNPNGFADMAVLIQGVPLLWVGIAGNIDIWSWEEGGYIQLFPTQAKKTICSVGSKRYGFIPAIVPIDIEKKKRIIVATSSLRSVIANSGLVFCDKFEFQTYLSHAVEEKKCDGSWILVEK